MHESRYLTVIRACFHYLMWHFMLAWLRKLRDLSGNNEIEVMNIYRNKLRIHSCMWLRLSLFPLTRSRATVSNFTLRARRAHNYQCIRVAFILWNEGFLFFFSLFFLYRRAFNEIVSGVSNRTHSATIILTLDKNEFKKRVQLCLVIAEMLEVIFKIRKEA